VRRPFAAWAGAELVPLVVLSDHALVRLVRELRRPGVAKGFVRPVRVRELAERRRAP
jgi:hypothetical protein